MSRNPLAPGPQRREDVLVRVVGRQDDDAGLAPDATIRRVPSIPSTSGIRTSISTTSGSARVHERSGLRAVARLADDLDVGLGVQDQPEAAANEGLVVGEDDADRHADGSNGRRAWTR